MRTDTAPQTKFLKDYQAPDFKIDSIDLTFDLREGTTTVTAKTTFTRLNTSAKNLTLDGQHLTLKSVAIDGADIQPGRYTPTSRDLTVNDVPDHFTLTVVTYIHPERNTSLQGLYSTGGNYCTQCEPEGFRKITYYLDRPDVMTTYTTRIEADKKLYPILLGNGNCTDKGDLADGRHYAVWHDPFVKPCYLFALVAGNLAHIHDTFTTMSGRKVDLYIYVNHGNEDKCQHAMDALKNSMKWDEEAYGREYDLDIFHIVAVNDFNFGAMENKSLNIFNSRLILAKPETATDVDYAAIEGVVAHEYFHNWTGNRITCRDWFQLSLKEGLTVFRDQMFSGDMNDHAVKRISDVSLLRNIQFPEDASPMAHPIRPDNYIEINNFYTATVYEKGAEIIHMMYTLLGAEGYRKATDLYFARHDGQAVTCDDFVKCMEDASGLDLTHFKLWYVQAGTPLIKVTSQYDAAAKKYTLTFVQTIPDTAGQKDKKPMHIPVVTGLLDKNGKDILPEGSRILHLKEKEQSFVFDNIAEKPVPSLLRGFSAPVKLTSDLTDSDLLFLMAHDTDGFNRWDSGQAYMQRLILKLIAGSVTDIPPEFISAFGTLINDKTMPRALLARAMTLPSEVYMAQLMDVIDVDGIHDARIKIMAEIGRIYMKELTDLYQANIDFSPYSPDPVSVGKRSLKLIVLRYIQMADISIAIPLADMEFNKAQNMTDKITALSILTDSNSPERKKAFEDFYTTWKDEALVLDKWFALQAQGDHEDVVNLVASLLDHPAFNYKNPNRVRALLNGFVVNNPKWFHRADGSGYTLLANAVIKLNGLNPQVASRILNGLRQWKHYDASRQALMEAALRRILAEKDLSPDVYEVASKSLNG